MSAKEPKRQLLLTSLTNYFQQNKRYRYDMFSIIHGSSTVSLRVLDWFVTHYSRMHQVIYWIDDDENKLHTSYPSGLAGIPRKFHVHLEYRAQLKSYTKMHFDPFRRHERIIFPIEDEVSLETTVGQLNFFRWSIENCVIQYVTENISKIEQEMAAFYNKRSLPTDGTVTTPQKGFEMESNEDFSIDEPSPPVVTDKKPKSPTKKNIQMVQHHVAPCHIRFD